MAALASVSPWIPEDDLLLKNAIEAGAALEALAKGAVQFSRKFTVRELRDRWHSLLYDPEISAQASARMVEFELSVSNPSLKSNAVANSKESSEVLGKRKRGSIRRLYYAMRKKFHSEGLNSTDLNFPVEPNGHDCITDGSGCPECVPSVHEPPGGNRLLGGCVSGHYGAHETDRDILHHPLPSGQDVCPDEMLTNDALFGFSADVSSQPLQEPERNDHGHSFDGLMLEDRHNDGLDSSTAMSEGNIVDLSDSLLNFENEDELLPTGIGVKNTVNEFPYDNLSSLLLSSPIDDHESEVVSASEHDASVSLMVNIETPGGDANDPKSLIVPNPSDSSYCGQHNADTSVARSSPVAESHSNELCTDVTLCTLSTEDPDIPDNDDIVFPIKTAKPVAPSLVTPTCREVSGLASTTYRRDSGLGQGLLKKSECSAQSYRGSNPIGSNTLSAIGLANQRISSEVKSAYTGLTVSQSADKKYQAPSKYYATQVTSSHIAHGGMEVKKSNFEDLKAQVAVKEHHVPHAGHGFAKMDFLGQEDGPLRSDLDENESDADVPNFSDIEAMILDMDLDPNHQDSYVFEKVSSYNNEDAKRKIIRLEQCAHSSLRRSIASRGAFAILYGRYTKHHIKKAEVLLGRATDDFDVDIDLGREAQANKISRRQAIIKLERDGSFWLKNVGRSSVFVSGKEVANGQLLCLSPSCLIEIRELSFVFEINSEALRQYAASIDKTGQPKQDKFHWSPQGGS